MADLTDTEKHLLWTLRDLVAETCLDTFAADSIPWDGPVPVFSGFVGKKAEAIAVLANYGLVQVEGDNGGRVIGGKLLGLADTAQHLKTGVFAEK